MKPGICTWSFAWSATGKRNVVDLSRLAFEAGFSGLEGAFSSHGGVNAAHSPPKETAVPIASLATLDLHRFSVAARDARRREAAAKTISDMLECATAWGIPGVSISLGPKPPDYIFERYFEVICRALAPHVSAAERLGVRLSVENVPHHLLDSRQSVEALLAVFPSLGLCLDVGNTAVDPPFEQWWTSFHQRVTKIHLSGIDLVEAYKPAGNARADVDRNYLSECLASIPSSQVFLEIPWDGKTPEDVFIRQLAEAIDEWYRGEPRT